VLNLEQALAGLPTTTEALAEFLIGQDCKGTREDGTCCPVANYLDKVGDFVDPFVDTSYIKVRADEDDEYGEIVDTPEHVRQFVLGFDQGEWPELDADREAGDE